MNLYLISQRENGGYDTYDSAVVAAKSHSDARKLHPCKFVTHSSEGKWMGTYSGGDKKGSEYINESGSWVRYSDINLVTVDYLGKTCEDRGVILASFNAG